MLFFTCDTQYYKLCLKNNIWIKKNPNIKNRKFSNSFGYSYQHTYSKASNVYPTEVIFKTQLSLLFFVFKSLFL